MLIPHYNAYATKAAIHVTIHLAASSLYYSSFAIFPLAS